MPTQDEVREALRLVQDPELMMSMVDLGLIDVTDVPGGAAIQSLGRG
jgi:metal-sulfur cluster biosynthetic enzyme